VRGCLAFPAPQPTCVYCWKQRSWPSEIATLRLLPSHISNQESGNSENVSAPAAVGPLPAMAQWVLITAHETTIVAFAACELEIVARWLPSVLPKIHKRRRRSQNEAISVHIIPGLELQLRYEVRTTCARYVMTRRSTYCTRCVVTRRRTQ